MITTDFTKTSRLLACNNSASFPIAGATIAAPRDRACPTRGAAFRCRNHTLPGGPFSHHEARQSAPTTHKGPAHGVSSPTFVRYFPVLADYSSPDGSAKSRSYPPPTLPTVFKKAPVYLPLPKSAINPQATHGPAPPQRNANHALPAGGRHEHDHPRNPDLSRGQLLGTDARHPPPARHWRTRRAPD